jgi:polysaccharide export outer membrane protein
MLKSRDIEKADPSQRCLHKCDSGVRGAPAVDTLSAFFREINPDIKDSMKKNSPAACCVLRIVFAAATLGMLSGQAMAQTFGQAAELPSAQAPAQTQTPEAYPDRPLPTITNGRLDGRQGSNQMPSDYPGQYQNPYAGQNQYPGQANGVRERRLPAERYDRDGKEMKGVFSTYVETVTGMQLPLFGKELFTDVPSTYSPLESAQVNGEYVLGTGDEVQIRGWGMINVDVTATVDRSGAIYIPRVGAVKVAGVKYRDLQGHLKQAVGKIFNNFELTASIAQTRALQIYVVGHAQRPGTYTLNSMSTLLNALFTSGGPSASGSMRNIQLKRGRTVVSTFDLYDMLVKGDKSGDATLRDGDVIYIPEVGPLVALSGNVKTPGIFELKGPASLAELMSWAGGVDSSAEQKKIIIEKTVNNTYQPIAELIADKNAMSVSLGSIPITATDVVRVFAPDAVPVRAQLGQEFVRVSGEAKQTGVFRLRPGETLRDLMFRLGGVTDAGYVYATQLKRESVRRTQQLKLDEIASRFERDVESSARLGGATDKDAVSVKVAELERQRRVAEKLRSVKAEGRIVLELDNGDAQVKHLPTLALQDGDSIFVPRKPGTVEVIGSVFQSNSFIYKPRRSVKDYISLAGGATASADEKEMYLIRADGTARSGRGSWFTGLGGAQVNPGDTVVVPETIERSSFRQSLKEWTAIFYQFGLGAAGLKVLKD